MSEYTKGPWFAEDNPGDWGMPGVVFIEAENTGRVATIDYRTPYCMGESRSIVLHAITAKANARLIAAAPDLLEALKGIYYALVSEPIVDGEDSEDCWLLKPSSAVGVMQNALAAIAKAEGRQ